MSAYNYTLFEIFVLSMPAQKREQRHTQCLPPKSLTALSVRYTKFEHTLQGRIFIPPCDVLSKKTAAGTLLPPKPFYKHLPQGGSFLYINMHKMMGRKMAGTRFMTLTFVAPSMFSARAAIIKDPTQVISAMTLSLRKGWR